MSFFSKVIGAVFGGSNSGKSAVETVAETYERFNPSDVKKHEMDLETDAQADASQANARTYSPPTHDTWFDVLIDGWGRAIRPAVSTYVCGILFGWIDASHLQTFTEMTWNLVWLVLSFWFGQRVIFKDIPLAYKVIKGLRNGN